MKSLFRHSAALLINYYYYYAQNGTFIGTKELSLK